MKNIFEYYDEETYLAHHGIKGQKWGVRRYQNKDGSYTEAGKARYYKQSGSNVNNYSGYRWHESELEYKFNPNGKYNAAGGLNNKEFNESADRGRDLGKQKNAAEHLEKLQAITDREFSPSENRDLADVYNAVTKYSGSWYDSAGISDGFSKLIKADAEFDNSWRAQYANASEKQKQVLWEKRKEHKLDFEDRILSTVCKDLGWEDTQEMRKALYYYVFID